MLKLFGLLEATAGHKDGRPLAELAAEVGLAKPTAHRILKTLVALGYMERVGNGVYRQTQRIRRLVSDADDRRLVRAADKPLRDLWERSGETVNLGTLRQGKIVYLTVLESRQPLRRTVSPTMTDPFACTALGRAIAAYLPDERLAYLLKTTPLEKRTPHTVVDQTALKKLIAATKVTGVATEEDETDLGVMCVGAPVFDRSGVAAAVSLSAPTARATAASRERWAEWVKATAEQITARLTQPAED
ncbi:Transcriptional regulator, IclR family [Fimbriiglobus ruber]|uniref:Transcriptional regulator, IclR family n=1 Tax=Fimbriiglobus ruber TaxID=1908690 RepID=A0A225DR78_9BACT|nr:Transcriptional regulator, IclR family [Fimbriiglobus ruber]